jgi:adiponectin receptor
MASATATAMVSILRLPHSPQPTIALTEGGMEEARNVLLSFDQLPNWHQDNEFILHGYRSISSSSWISFRSWLYIHNESVNIYSHLVPTIIFLLSEWYLLQYLKSQYSYITSVDVFIFCFFITTVIICLGLSTTYHTLMNHSSNIEQLWLQFDLVGIVILILGVFISGIYMVFWCEPLERKLYWSMVIIISHPYLLYIILTLLGRLEFLLLLLSLLC